MPDAQDENGPANDPVADDIGPDGHQFTVPSTRRPAAFREICKRVAGVEQPFGHLFGGVGIELADVGAYAPEVSDR